MRIGGGSATGNAISHSRLPSCCAILFEKSDMYGRICGLSKVGEGAPRQTSPTLTTRQVMVHVWFFMYESYDIGKNRKACCSMQIITQAYQYAGVFSDVLVRK
jgi:hypothetical protein